MGEKVVLFVDDEIHVLNALKRFLIGENYKCIFSKSAYEALDFMNENKISVLVTDMKMPGMDGLSLLRIVKDKYPNTVRVVLSGYSYLPQIIGAINQGDIYRYITKPWKISEEFLPAIRQALDYHELLASRDEFMKTLEMKNKTIQNILVTMDDKLSKSKKEYENIRSFIDTVFTYFLIGLNVPGQTSINSLRFFNAIQMYCKGYLDIAPIEEGEFELNKLIGEIKSNIYKAGNFQDVIINGSKLENTTCYGSLSLSLFVLMSCIKVVTSSNIMSLIKMDIMSKCDKNSSIIEISANIKNVTVRKGITIPIEQNNLSYFKDLVNATMQRHNICVDIESFGDDSHISCKIMSPPEAMQLSGSDN